MFLLLESGQSCGMVEMILCDFQGCKRNGRFYLAG